MKETEQHALREIISTFCRYSEIGK